MEPAGPPVSSRPKLPSHGLLRYDDPLAHAATKPVDVGAVAYRAAKNQGGSWAVGGELPRLTALRSSMGCWLPGAASSSTVREEDVDRLSALAGQCLNLAEQVMTIPGWLSEWTSPLTAIGGPPKGLLGGLLGGGGGGSSGGPRFWKAEVVQQEAAMWCFMHAAALRQAGLDLARTTLATAPADAADAYGVHPTPAPQYPRDYATAHPDTILPPEAEATPAAGGGETAGAVALLRQAAGAFSHLSTRVLPLAAMAAAAAGKDRRATATVPELRPEVAGALCCLCLAEAQTVATARACIRGVSDATLAGLEAGCAQLFAQARVSLGAVAFPSTDTTGANITPGMVPAAGGSRGGGSGAAAAAAAVPRLAAYLALNHLLHGAAARVSQAATETEAGELGRAVACYTEAMVGLKEAARAAAGPGGDRQWGEAVEQYLGELEAAHKRADTDRLHVTLQPLPQDAPSPPPPKVMVTALECRPRPYTPAPPPAMQERKGEGCSIQ